MNTLFDTDLLAQVDAVVIENTQRISEEDRQFCEDIQKHCHSALAQLQESFQQMMEQSKPYIESGMIKIRFDETYENSYDEWTVKDIEKKYQLKHFIPCKQEKTIRILFTETCRMFVTDIIGYFNNKYGINISDSNMFRDVPNIKNFDATYRPNYHEIVDMVIAHLGGRSFAQTMEDEVYSNALRDYQKKWANVKGSILNVEHYAHTCMFDNDLNYGTIQDLNRFMDALYYYCTGAICKMTPNDFFGTRRQLQQGEKYTSFFLPEIEHFKFYKNNKMEVKFKNPNSAKEFHAKITKEIKQ